ncbi:DNA-binding transcriptional activator YeiL [Pseudovibrio axinellae]|uniref:DNA-binding transcriptional activator YeiL n=1 Tax=Pseudovibrio axinellae TaxID=989403 RepID=A0A165YWM6_9HYPH|nr:Crp/Fnr family transcriptional regulator [Pseudovibrio axinellae]KZL19300.1 DNA-binding transcriptional activator YeiL [Pseudovibrio axinellae]SEQ42268.1 cAMP-binding domain of CRP or a regulatory subunit of cAMP-dependent protein kinases [Pseudovibrio axinellae]
MTIKTLAQNGHKEVTQWIKNGPFVLRRMEAGDYLLRQGQILEHLYWVEDGFCTVSYTAANGRRFSHGRFSLEYRLYGEIEFLTGKPVQFDIRCDGDVSVRVIPKADLETLLAQKPHVGIWLSQYLADTYQGVMDRVTTHFMYPLAYNIAKDLLLRELGNKPPLQFERVFREAERFGCSERVYRRAVSQLLEQGLVEKTGRVLKVADKDKLERYLAEEEQ